MISPFLSTRRTTKDMRRVFEAWRAQSIKERNDFLKKENKALTNLFYETEKQNEYLKQIVSLLKEELRNKNARRARDHR